MVGVGGGAGGGGGGGIEGGGGGVHNEFIIWAQPIYDLSTNAWELLRQLVPESSRDLAERYQKLIRAGARKSHQIG